MVLFSPGQEISIELVIGFSCSSAFSVGVFVNGFGPRSEACNDGRFKECCHVMSVIASPPPPVPAEKKHSLLNNVDFSCRSYNVIRLVVQLPIVVYRLRHCGAAVARILVSA